MLLRLMEQVGASPGETLMIGDTTHDLQLAHNAGAAALAVAYGAHALAGLAEQRPLATLHSVPELRAWLRDNVRLPFG
jgi:phosphoglycolate phosphatase